MPLPNFRTPIGVTPRLLEDLPPDSPGIASLLRALEEISSIARELEISREVTLSDELLSDNGKEREICNGGRNALTGADTILGNAIKKADGDLMKLESKLSKVLPELTEGAHSAEIRAHIKALPDSERRAFVLAAMASDTGLVTRNE